ncbi:hypothetical protein [Bacillus infantis]|uniref:hypothetical protein n=1 Tax=Bacillus infantis TaxID=324767 RepID=UPI003CE9BA45
MKLTNGTAYKSITTGLEMILTEDNGKWYLNSHRGATKSVSAALMPSNLDKNWKAI